MKIYLQAFFDELKSLVLQRAQIISISPADCYNLSLAIKTATNKSISETTIKRVYGFAASKHNPSIYTLNALAEYCGYKNWETFYNDLQLKKGDTQKPKTWNKIANKAKKISLFNIQSNKHKCGIPYQLTIDRKYINTFMQQFEESKLSAAILSGPAGCGKTIAVSRWIEQQMEQHAANPKQDIFLFIHSISLLHATAFGYDCEAWLSYLLGINDDKKLDNFIDSYKRFNSSAKFYLIIDEIHNDLVNNKQFYTMMSNFTEMTHHFKQYEWFKFILILRDSTLEQHADLFNENPIATDWFLSSKLLNNNKSLKIDYFSNTELLNLLQNINTTDPLRQISIHSGQQLIQHPIFFQYYYDRINEVASPEPLSEVDDYLVISRFINKKILNTTHMPAKQALMEELAALIEQKDNQLQINKKNAYAIKKTLLSAYKDLLYSGILHEAHDDSTLRKHVYIRFQSDTIASYFIANRLYNRYITNNKTDELIAHLEGSAFNKKHKIIQLKWLLLFSIESGTLKLLNHLNKIQSFKHDNQDLIDFTCNALKKLNKTLSASTVTKVNRGLRNSHFVDYVLNHPCLDAQKHIETLLIFNIANRQQVIARGKLALLSLLKWEEEEFLEQLSLLYPTRHETHHDIVIHPYFILKYLYLYFKREKNTDHEVNNELMTLPCRLNSSNPKSSSQLIDLLIYIYVKVSGNIALARQYKSIIETKTKEFSKNNKTDNDFSIMLYVLFLLECGEVQTAFSHLEKISKKSKQNLIFRLMYIIFQLHTGKLHHNNEYTTLGKYAISLCYTHKLTLLEMYYKILLTSYIPKNETISHLRHLKHQHIILGQQLSSNTLN